MLIAILFAGNFKLKITRYVPRWIFLLLYFKTYHTKLRVFLILILKKFQRVSLFKIFFFFNRLSNQKFTFIQQYCTFEYKYCCMYLRDLLTNALYCTLFNTHCTLALILITNKPVGVLYVKTSRLQLSDMYIYQLAFVVVCELRISDGISISSYIRQYSYFTINYFEC